MPFALTKQDLLDIQEYFIPHMAENCCSAVLMNSENKDAPYLEITSQPCEKFRFRYFSEPGSHGVINARSNDSRSKKKFPTVKLVNVDGLDFRKILIRVRLFTADENPRLHVLSISKTKSQDGALYEKLSKDFSVEFRNLGIFVLKKEEIIAALQHRKKLELNVQTLNEEEEKRILEEWKTFNLNETKLYFEAVWKDSFEPVDGYGVLSDTIYNSKATATGDLKICRISLFKGCEEGEEDMIILCDKIKKDDIEIRFFERGSYEEVIWEKLAKFNPSDVHYQVAIPFKTPKYDGPSSKDEMEVFIQLSRKSDGKSGEPVQFVYKRDSYPSSKKRKLSSSFLDDIDFENLLDLKRMMDPNEILLHESECSPFSFANSSSNSPDEYVKMDAGIINQTIVIEGQMNGEFNCLSLEDTDTKKFTCMKKNSEGFSRRVQSLLKKRNILYYVPESVKIQDNEGNSVLHIAILENQQIEFIEEVIKRINEDLVNHRNLYKQTPLHLATQLGDNALLKLLLRSGGNPTHKDKIGNSCLHIAAMHDFSRCMKTLWTFLPSDQKELSSTINSENDDGLSPLHLSILNDSKNCLKILYRNNADINLQEKKGGKSPLHLAIEKKSAFIEILLSQNDIDIDSIDYKGQTALELACEENQISYDDLASEVKDDKDQMLMYLKKILEVKSAEHGSSLDLEMKESELQKKIESILNRSSDWKKLGPMADIPEKNLNHLLDFEENPAGALIDTIKKSKGFKLKEIIEKAGLKEKLINLKFEC